MLRLVGVFFLILTATIGATAAASKSPEPGTSVEMPYLMAPLATDDKLIAYAYISSKVIASSPSTAIDIRNKTPFIQDAFVRDVNGAPIGSHSDPTKINSAALAARLLGDARQIMGSAKVAGLEIIRIQIAQLKSGS